MERREMISFSRADFVPFYYLRIIFFSWLGGFLFSYIGWLLLSSLSLSLSVPGVAMTVRDSDALVSMLL